MTSKQRWILALTALASMMSALDATVVATALPTIHRDLHASLSSLEWTISAYSLTFAVLMMTAAAVGERYGRRRTFVAGLAIFSLGSTACALAPGIGALIASRAAQGAGAAIMLPLALTQLGAAFPAASRGRALGIFAGLSGLAVFLGPVIGGAVAQGLAWQWIFWINVPIGIAAIVLVRRHLDETAPTTGRLDLIGAVLVTGACFGVVWALVRGDTAGWASAQVLGAGFGGVASGAAFVAWERVAPAPMLPMRFFANRTFSSANIANFCLYTALTGGLFMVTQYLQNALGYGPLAAGLRIMTWTGTLMICGPLAGTLADRFGERRFLAGGLALNALGMAWLGVIATPQLPYSQMVLPLIVSGCGLTMAMPALQKAVVGAVAPHEIGAASGALNTIRTLGGAFGVAILGAVFAAGGSFATPRTFTHGYAPAMLVAGGISLVGAFAGLAVPGRARPNVVVEPAPELVDSRSV